MGTELAAPLKEKARLGLSLDARDYGGSVTRRLPDGRLEHTQVWVLFDGVEFRQNFWRERPPETAEYWVAAGGRAFGLTAEEPECIANAEAVLRGLGFTEVYATWRYKDATPAKWKAWEKKWAKRCRDDANA